MPLLSTPSAGGGAVDILTRTAGEALSVAQVLAIDAAGEAFRADATLASGLWRTIGISDSAVLAAAQAIVLSGHGEEIPILFASAPAAVANGELVFLSTTPGEGTLIPSFASGTVLALLGILSGADGVLTTPTVIYIPQLVSITP